MADALSSSSSNPNLHLITGIILHDISLLCSVIISYPLYFSYFLFLSRYVIKLISFVSPLFIATVFLSLLLTTTTAFCPNLPQLELGILHTVIQKLKSNIDEVNGDEKDRHFEDFEIYKILFDGTENIREHLAIDGRKFDARISYSHLDELGTENMTENSVNGARRNDATISDLDTDKLGVDNSTPQSSVIGCRRTGDAISDSDTENLGVEKLTENSVNGGRRNDVTISDSHTDKLGVENSTPESSVHGSWRNDVTVSDSDTENLGVEKITENAVIQRNDDAISDVEKITENSVNTGRTISDSHTDKLGVENSTPESSVNSSRRNDVIIRDSYVDELENEKGFEKLLAELDRFEDCTPTTETDANSDKVDAGPVINYVTHGQNSVRSSSLRSDSSRVLNNYGSMREEKEWRRTLACKLFEERYNSRGGEDGMDSLWEAYENKTMIKIRNNGGTERFDDEDEEMSNGHLCCLQALKLSTRKTNLGMRKNNLVKISKVIKGFGWLHHVKKKKKKYGN